ncbi:MAG TPA: family 16 glycosylhydrolase [Chitinophagaceae bacterium]|nr:family 16 glycosylhydrolase [Chitinophagaceae bacterium]
MKSNCIVSILLTLTSLGCAKGKSDPGSLPAAGVNNVTQSREDTASTFRFSVTLSAASTKTVSVQYATVDGSASSPKDYTAGNGTLTFQPGETKLYIDVKVSGDSLRQPDQDFFVQLSSPQNCTISINKGTGTILNDGTYLPTDESGYTTPVSYPGYQLAWSDEFDSTAINTNDWNFETGGNGWGNHELEYYTARTQNAFVSSGNLVIEARSESYGGSNYTSARMTTAGKREFQYGRIDIRAKLPVSAGMWPALWMLGSNFQQAGWPGCGETDIMELIGKNPKQVVGSFHWQKGDGSEGTVNNVYNATEDFSRHFHVFSLVWDKDSMQILVDDQVYVTGTSQNITSGNYPFNAPFFLIFNVAVGGDWPGPPDGTTIFPQRMFVDYVRVFQK